MNTLFESTGEDDGPTAWTTPANSDRSAARGEPEPSASGALQRKHRCAGAATAPIRVALVHDWLNQLGGAEVVLEVLHRLFPDAPILTTMLDTSRVPVAADWDVRCSWMNRLPGIHAHHRTYLPLYPLVWRTTRLSGYDLVISNKSGFCHGVRPGRAVHVCYCLTPTRYVWQSEDYLRYESMPPLARQVLWLLLPALRRWDRSAADRVHHFVAISTAVRDRIARFYGRRSELIFPPVDLDRRAISTEVDEFHLVVARLAPYKRIDVAVAAFNRLGRKLIVVGEGRDRARLEELAGPTIEFRGRLPDEEVAWLMARCRALVWPGIEDYGLAPVEVMASGRPVVALRGGGVLDTVAEGITGIFFDAPEADALARAVLAAEAVSWQPGAIRTHAQRFGRPVFESRLTEHLQRCLIRGEDDD